MNQKKRLEKLQKLADKLLDTLTQQVEESPPDPAAIKQICATMKDLKDIQLACPKETEKQNKLTVRLSEELEEYSN